MKIIFFPKRMIQPLLLPLLNIPLLWKSKIITISNKWKERILSIKNLYSCWWKATTILELVVAADWNPSLEFIIVVVTLPRSSSILTSIHPKWKGLAKIKICGWTCANRASIINFWPDLWLASIVVAALLLVAMLVWSLFHGFTFPFDSQRNHHLRVVAKSFVDLVKSFVDFFKPPFVIDGSFFTRTVVSHQIEVKILALIPILV